MKKIASVWIIVFVLSLASPLLFANQAAVQGQIIAQSNNLPVPGLTVSLVHAMLGRSAPSVTDVAGRFLFYGIPIMPTPYYIEIYWGNQLIYSSPISVSNHTVILPTIVL